MSNECGYLEIILGCMFSGKTSYLIEKYLEYNDPINNVIVINSILDSSSTEEYLISHKNIKIPALKLKKLSDLDNIKDNKNYNIILINEAQFFEDLIKFTKNSLNQNKILYISGLDGDFRREKFGQILDIIPLADCVTKLRGTCYNCKINASLFSHRISKELDTIIVGSEDKYIPLCRKCFQLMNK